MKDSEQLKQEIEELEAEHKEMGEKIKRLKNQKIEVPGGDYFVSACGSAYDNGPRSIYFGFQTKRYAKELAKINKNNRIIMQRYEMLMLEKGEKWEADWDDSDQSKWWVRFDRRDNKWADFYSAFYEGSVVYMPKFAALQICEELNQGLLEGVEV